MVLKLKNMLMKYEQIKDNLKKKLDVSSISDKTQYYLPESKK